MKMDEEKLARALSHIAYRNKHSRPMDVHKTSDYPEVNQAVKKVADDLEHLLRNELKRNRKRYMIHIKTLLLDLYVATLEGDDMYVGFPRKRNNQRSLRLKALRISGYIIVKLIDALAELGYVETVMGVFDFRANQGYQSRVKATDKLIGLLVDYDINDTMIDRHDYDEIILRKKVKGGRKIDIDFPETEDTMVMRARVRRINRMLKKSDIRLALSKRDLARLQRRMRWTQPNFRPELIGTGYRRIYNDDFEHGGRFYGHWCLSIPSEFRRRITINGEPVVELDYSGLHLRMLYDLAGKTKPAGDMYSYPKCPIGKDARRARKIIMQTIINADNKTKAYHGAYKSIQEAGLGMGYLDVVYEAHQLMGHHRGILDYFCSGIGTTLQWHDSEIAMAIMLDLVAQRIPVLPVHDSFLVTASAEAELRHKMIYHYQSRLNGVPVIDRKG